MGCRSCSGGGLQAPPFWECVGRGRSNAGLLHDVFRALQGCTAALWATLWADSKAGENQGTPISYEPAIALGISCTEPALHSLAIEV